MPHEEEKIEEPKAKKRRIDEEAVADARRVIEDACRVREEACRVANVLKTKKAKDG